MENHPCGWDAPVLADAHGTAQKAKFRSRNGHMSLRSTNMIRRNFGSISMANLIIPIQCKAKVPVSHLVDPTDHLFGNRLDGAVAL